ncbi:M48 family metallopeptidase [Massilia sp. R2A-15]|uniref:M48 family metallopeptidase n=1 Tax=Massilia sp. R2A-15 TaxID=3064278 RepID=UPI0027377655|nr:M48 family metallopeptidase [Massilia sp. R2A-15]WLI89373.1 M48 family metallopeptidase [Massilia sp. R2A-15]
MDLIYKNEKVLFVIMLTLSCVVWLGVILGTLGGALIWALVIFVMYCFAQSALISYIKGTAVQITEKQFPDLYRRIDACCDKLEHIERPQAYLMQMGGALNAFATRFLGRDFLVLYSDVVDALHEIPDALNFYIGHEIGHIKRKHLLWSTVLIPASLMPLIGAAYSRAREYTCDRHGLAACDRPESAQAGIAALAAGGKRGATMCIQAYSEQSLHTDGFWMSFHELVADYPWLVKRMGAVRALAQGQEVKQPRRHPLAVLLAFFTPRIAGAGAAGPIVMVAIIAMSAAVLVPAYQQYKVRAAEAAAFRSGDAAVVVEKFDSATKEIPATSEQPTEAR